jgi:hypothetical protein
MLRGPHTLRPNLGLRMRSSRDLNTFEWVLEDVRFERGQL